MSITIRFPGLGSDPDATTRRRALVRAGGPVLAEVLLTAATHDAPGLRVALAVARTALGPGPRSTPPSPGTDQLPIRENDPDATAATGGRSPMSTSAVMQVKVGAVNLDVPRSMGHYGGTAIAVGLGLIEPPLGVCIAAVPLLKLLTHRALPVAVRLVGELMERASKPVGVDDEAVFPLDDEEKTDTEAVQIGPQVDRGPRLQDAGALDEAAVAAGNGQPREGMRS